MRDIELIVKISEDAYKATCNGCMLPPDVENVVQGIKNGIKKCVGFSEFEQQPCDDAISRAEVHDLLATWLSDYLTEETREALETIGGKVEDMQSVIPKTEPCEDAISRAALLEELGEEPFNWNDSPEAFQEVRDYQWFRSLVENAPPVTTKQKTGKWKLLGCYRNGHGRVYNCSECGETEFYVSNYCPNCGARMEVEE